MLCDYTFLSLSLSLFVLVILLLVKLCLADLNCLFSSVMKKNDLWFMMKAELGRGQPGLMRWNCHEACPISVSIPRPSGLNRAATRPQWPPVAWWRLWVFLVRNNWMNGDPTIHSWSEQCQSSQCLSDVSALYATGECATSRVGYRTAVLVWSTHLANFLGEDSVSRYQPGRHGVPQLFWWRIKICIWGRLSKPLLRF